MTRATLVSIGLVLALATACGAGAPPGDADAATTRDGAVADEDGGVDAPSAGADVVDRDGDGVVDARDAFPDDPSEAFDGDGDGVGNAAEPDEDGDGVPDVEDAAPFDPVRSAPRVVEDVEPDGVVAGTAPVTLRGAIADAADADTFTLEAPAGTAITAFVRAGAVAVAIVRASDGAPLRTNEVAPDDATTVSLVLAEAGVAVRVSADVPSDYVVDVMIDRDLDLADDARELALGVDPERSDADEDTLLDGLEIATPGGAYYADPSPDADGLASWRDADSDGDGLPDIVERAADRDGDQLGASLDTDSDGDGTSDASERGDRDGDGLADAIDADSDGDGLLEPNDSAPETPLPIAPPSASGPRIDGVGTAIDATLVDGVAHPDGSLVIEGAGFGGDPAAIWVMLAPASGSASRPPIDVRPSAATDARIEIALPDVAVESVAVAIGGVRTAWWAVRGARRGDPIATSMTPETPTSGQTVTLRGRSLDLVSTVEVRESDAAADVVAVTHVSPEEISFVAPGRSGAVTLVGVRALRGEVRVPAGWLAARVAGGATVAIPAGVSFALTDLFVQGGTGAAARVAAGGSASFETSASGPEIISALLPDAGVRDVVVLQAVATSPGVRLDTTSTAVAYVAATSGALERLSGRALNDALISAQSLPEVLALAAEIGAALARDPRGLESPDATLAARGGEATRAFVTGVLGDSTTLPVVAPGVISPEVLHDVRVYERSGDERGYLAIENETQMFLSVRLRDLDTDLVLLEHVDGFFDDDIVGTQSGVLTVFIGEDEELDTPRYRSSRIEVITPGMAGALPDDEVARDAYFYVWVRSLVEKAVLPLVDMALGVRLDPHRFLHLFVQQLADQVQIARDLVLAGSPRDGWMTLFDALKNDVDNLGPLTRGLATWIGREALEAAVRRVATKLVPLVGWLAAAEGISSAATAINLGRYAFEVWTTPPVLEFTAAWELAIESVVPRYVEPGGADRRVYVRGARLAPVELPGGGVELPLVVFTNPDAGTLELRAEHVWEDGTNLDLVLPRSYVERARGVIGVEVRHRGDSAVADRGIHVTALRRIDEIDPPAGRLGSIATVRGGVFSGDRSRVAVFFESTSDETDPARIVRRAEVLESSATEIRVIVPRDLLPATSGEIPLFEYTAFAEIGAPGFGEPTNRVGWSHVMPGSFVYRYLDPREPRELWQVMSFFPRPPSASPVIQVHWLHDGRFDARSWTLFGHVGSAEHDTIRVLGMCPTLCPNADLLLEVDTLSGRIGGHVSLDSPARELDVVGYVTP